MPVRALLFDLDGTLVDTNPVHAEAWEQAFLRFGYSVAGEAVADAIGKGGEILVTDVAGAEAERRHGDALRDARGEIFQGLARRRRFELFPQARALMAEARRRGLRTAIATSASQDDLDLTFERAGADLGRDVDAITTASDVEDPKPDPDIVQAALDKLGVPPAEVLLIGDTPWDVEAARRAGARCLGVATWVHDRERLLGSGAAAVYADTADLLAHLDDALRA